MEQASMDVHMYRVVCREHRQMECEWGVDGEQSTSGPS